MSRTINGGRALGMAAALVGAAGAARATVFTFTPQCNSNWYGECTTTPCGGGGWNTFNNWNNQAACVGGFATPGAADGVVLPPGLVRQNGGVAVDSISTNAATQWEWDQGNLSIVQPFAQAGTLNINSGYKTGTGAFTNVGTWNFVDTNGFILYFQGLSLTNNAAMTQANMHVENSGGTNLFTNNGTYAKNHASSTNWSAVPIVNNNLMRADLGTQVFTSVPITTTNAAARWNVSAAGAMTFNSCALTGSLIGTSQNSMSFNTMTLGGPLSWNIGGNGLVWNTGNVNLAGSTLTNAATGRATIAAGYKTAVDGSITNQGEWNFADTNGFIFYFQNLAFTNNAAITQANMHVESNGGANVFTNNGTYIKNHASSTNWSAVPIVNNNLIRADVGTQVFSGVPITTTNAAARWNVGPAGAMTFNSCTLTGSLIGTSQNSMSFSTMSLGGPLSWNVGGNGLVWSAGNMNLAGNTLTNTPTGRVSIAAGYKTAIGGSITNQGEWNFADTNGFIFYFQNLSFTNNAVITQASMNVESGGGVNVFTNNGTYLKNHNSGTTWTSVPIINNGVVGVDVGTHSFNSSPIASIPAARWNTAAGAAMVFNSPAFAGTMKGASAGSTFMNTPILSDDTTFDFSGNGIVWQGGNATVPAGKVLVNAATGLITVADASYKTLIGNAVNDGLWTDSSPSGFIFYFQNSTFTNNGEVVKRGLHWESGGGTNLFVNNGYFRKTTGSSVSVNAIPFSNNGVVHVEQGTLSLNSVPFTQSGSGHIRVDGTLGVNGTFTVGAGRISGTGGIGVPGGANPGLVNAGCTIAPGNSPGILTVSGNYTQQTSGVLEVELYGTAVGSGYDRLAVTGNAALGGTLRLQWPVGDIPSIGDSFTILTTATNGRTGTFSTIDNTELGYVVDVTYLPSSVVVTILDIVCDDIDYNGDGLFPDTADIDDFLSVFSGGPCSTGTCGDIDFNNDGLFPDTQDIDTLLQVFSGGGCV